jgi:hypothetical protein
MPWTLVVCGTFFATGGAGAFSFVCAMVFAQLNVSRASAVINTAGVKVRLIEGPPFQFSSGAGIIRHAEGKRQNGTAGGGGRVASLRNAD